MKGHLGAVLTSGLSAVALALALLQAVIVAHSAPRLTADATASRSSQTNRYSVPGGRSGIPWLPFDEKQPSQKPEERRAPAPAPSHRQRALPGIPGPRAPRKATA